MAERNNFDEHILDWFEIGKKAPTFIYKTHTGRMRHVKDEGDTASTFSFSTNASTTDRTSYAKYYQDQEEEALRCNTESKKESPKVVPYLEDCEALTSADGNLVQCAELLHEQAAELYSRYDFNRLPNTLIISDYKEEILSRIDTFPTVVIHGCTGSGKTTQIPQYILDHSVSERKHCNIIVTQPRRIAAMSIAKRVAQERNWTVGDLVGYQIGLNAKVGDNTRITYVTTGVLLQKLVANKSLDAYTHVIIDEVHERDQEIDFILILVRKLQRSVSKSTKIIIMSATLNSDIYAEYFSYLVGNRMVPANIFEIEEDNRYHVFEHYLEDLAGMGQLPNLDVSTPSFPIESVAVVCKLIETFDRMESRLMKQNEEFAANRGSVLIFLPGIEEINTMHKALEKSATHKKWWLLPLHSSVTLEEQNRVFDRPERYQRKIILATNIAESSITVQDVVYVVDFCLTRHLVCNPESHYTGLQLDWASKSNCIQRKGRAGRVAIGRVYRMVPQHFYETFFSDYGIPEMKRCPLSRCVLQSKLLDMGEPKAILGLAIDPPDLSGLEQTIISLLEIGALTIKRNANKVINFHDGELTWIGKTIAKLPIEINLGKLILLGYAFGCLEDCIIMAAGLSQRSVFSRPFKEPLKAYETKFSWADNSFSDCIAIRNVYRVWKSKRRGFGGPGSRSEKTWADSNFIQLSRLKEMESLVKELIQRLDIMNIKIPVHQQQDEDGEQAEIKRVLLIKLILAGAFYPRYFTHSTLDEEIIVKELSGYDPLRTVVISGLPLGQAHLYGFAIENLFTEPCKSSLKIHFDRDSSRAYVEFLHPESKSESITENRGEVKSFSYSKAITPAVYLAIKMRMLRIPMEIKLLSPREASRLVDKVAEHICRKDCRVLNDRYRVLTYSHSQMKQIALPAINISVIEFRITEVIDCGHFWARHSDVDNNLEYKRLQMLIKLNISNYNKEMTGSLLPGAICLAPINLTEYARARIEYLKGSDVGVFFVDFGSTKTCNRSKLVEVNTSECAELVAMPMRAFECKLSGIRPSDSAWSTKSNEYFHKMTNGRSLLGRIYSIVRDIVRMEIMYKNSRNRDVSLNDDLVDRRFAVIAEEDILSKKNNSLRCNDYGLMNESFDKGADNLELIQLLSDKELTGLTQAGKKLKIKGPHSPVELQFGGITRDSLPYSVRIEPDSVNSVALCSEPQNKHVRLLIASELSVTPTGTTVIARNTTFLPNIHGLLSLILMIFAPQVEFRTNKKRVDYTGLLSGLGFDEVTNKAIYPNHDIEINFNVKITEEDIHMANDIRMGVNLLLGKDHCEWNFHKLYETQMVLQNSLINYILKHREHVNYNNCMTWMWNETDRKYLLRPEHACIEDSMSVFPLLSGIVLVDISETETMKDNVKELHRLFQSGATRISTQCLACKVDILNREVLKKHLDDVGHRENEFKLWEQN